MINLTPHAISIRLADGTTVTIPPSGAIARVEQSETVVGSIPLDTGDSVPVITRTKGRVIGLPYDPVRVGGCLVSSMVLDALPPGTPGVYAPDTGATAIRNEKGHIVAVTRLVTA